MTRRSGAFLGACTLAVLVAPAPAGAATEIGLDAVDLGWRFEPIVVITIIVLAALFLQAWWRLRRRGRTDLAGWDRLALFAAALTLGGVAVASPLDTIGETYLISAHMLQHMLIGDVAPALLVVAIRGPLCVFLLPKPLLRPLAQSRALRAALHRLLSPGISFGAWALALGAWHVPAAYDYVLEHRLAHDLEHTSFVVGGLLAWLLLVDPARRGILSRTSRLGFAAAMFAGGQALAYTMVLSFTALYPAYAAQPERLFGLSPVTDQKIAGVVMMVDQVLTLGLFAWLTVRTPTSAREERPTVTSGGATAGR